MKPAEIFQRAIDKAINEAAAASVHPALVYTVLGHRQAAVLRIIENAEQNATAESVLKNNETELRKTDSN